jgi:competence protein ComEC
MTKIERVELLSSKKDYLYLFTLFILLLSASLTYQYDNYKELTKFDSQLVHATILKEYTKTKTTKKGTTKSYKVLKLRSDKGFIFYTTTKKDLPDYKGKSLLMEIYAGKITFLEYLKNFFAFSKILKVDTKRYLRERLSNMIEKEHSNKNAAALYKALFIAEPLPYTIQQQLSNLGISHLIAISGFHLGVLSAILFFLIKQPYKLLQNNYFPYRSYQRDSFMFIALLLFGYMLFLDSPPSLLRAFVMLLVGFILYDRGIKIISLQTLLVSFLLLIALFPKLIFSIGFFLSLSGVFYIFLFLIHFQKRSRLWHFILLPFWIYLMMLPYSLVIFGNFSLYHPLSILLTSLFMLFYPLSIFLHLIGYGDLLDKLITSLLQIETHAINIKLSVWFLAGEILLSMITLLRREALYFLLLYSLSIFIYAIYHIT